LFFNNSVSVPYYHQSYNEAKKKVKDMPGVTGKIRGGRDEKSAKKY